jgi:hypothetical protein
MATSNGRAREQGAGRKTALLGKPAVAPGKAVVAPGKAGGRDGHGDAKHDCGCGGPSAEECHCHDAAAKDGEPDFAQMTVAEKLAYNQAKRDRIFG